VHTT